MCSPLQTRLSIVPGVHRRLGKTGTQSAIMHVVVCLGTMGLQDDEDAAMYYCESDSGDSDFSSLWGSDLDAVFFPTFSTRPTLLRSGPCPPRALASHRTAVTDQHLWVFGGRRRGPRGPEETDMFQYNLSTEQWAEVYSPLSPPSRWGHSLTAVPDASDPCGRQLVLYGGQTLDGEVCGDCWEFSLRTCTWRRCNSFASDVMPAPRVLHSAVLSDALLVVYGGMGGRGECLGGVHLFHKEAQQWLSAPDPPAGSGAGPGLRCGHSAVVHGGRMYIFGGQTRRERGPGVPGKSGAERVRLNDLHAYDLATGMWWELRPLHSELVPPPRWCHAAALYGPKMVLVGGSDCDNVICGDMYAFHLESHEWEKYIFPLKAKDFNVPLQRHSHTADLVGDGELLVIGGCHFQGQSRRDMLRIIARPLTLKELVALHILQHDVPYRAAPVMVAAPGPWGDLVLPPAQGPPGRAEPPRKRRRSTRPSGLKVPRPEHEDLDSVGPSSPSLSSGSLYSPPPSAASGAEDMSPDVIGGQ